MKRFYFLAPVLVLVVGLAGCTSSATSAGSSENPEPADRVVQLQTQIDANNASLRGIQNNPSLSAQQKADASADLQKRNAALQADLDKAKAQVSAP